MARPFGFAVIGAGMAAKPHALALQALAPDIAVRGVYTRSAERRAAFAKAYGFPEAASIDALAADPEIDAALILTPPDARGEIIRRFAETGTHILCEKPLERTVAAAAAVAQICQDRGVELGIVFQHRFRRASEAAAQMLHRGDLGTLEAVEVRVPWWRDQAYYDTPGRGTYARDGGGVLISQAIHTLDLMLHLAGPVTSVQAVSATVGHRMEAEDYVAGGLRFANGAVGSLVATTAAYPGAAEVITLHCSDAAAELRAGTLTVSWRDGRQETVGQNAGTGGGADPMAFPFEWHRDLIAAFVAKVQAGDPPVPGAAEALHVQRLIEALLQSSAEGRQVNVEAPA